MHLTPFHLAVPVRDVAEAKRFYVDVLGCGVGRESEKWVDLNLFGHQLVCHEAPPGAESSNPVDGDAVPVPHFGVVLTMDAWQALAARLSGRVAFVMEPHVRFRGEPGEQATLFFRDPSGNALEFKAFRDIGRELFKTT